MWREEHYFPDLDTVYHSFCVPINSLHRFGFSLPVLFQLYPSPSPPWVITLRSSIVAEGVDYLIGIRVFIVLKLTREIM